MSSFRWITLTCALLLTTHFTVMGQNPILPIPPDPAPQELIVPPEDLVTEAPPPPPKIWSGELEAGLNGATGNSDLFNLRLGGKAKRETPTNIMTLDWIYRYAKSESEINENRALINGKSEWPICNSPWSAFISGMTEYDEFKEFNVRISMHAGLGYQWIKNERTSLKTRLGTGASREIGGPDNVWTPEALFGLDFEHKLTERQKITASVEYFPDLSDFSEFRTIAKLNYELLIDPDWNLTLKLGLLDRFDSNSDGASPNDLNYFATLLWSF